MLLFFDSYLRSIITFDAKLVFLSYAQMTWYVVYVGRVPGVYDDWDQCRRQVHGFSGNSYKGYKTMVEAEARYATYLAREKTEKTRARMTTFAIAVLILLVLLVLMLLVVLLV